ncbi:MAG: hypothetical protein K2X11_09415 [Acetobacteraceae bacterium]|nr:hypothetical protein [Acetobacteraceae bacterium]
MVWLAGGAALLLLVLLLLRGFATASVASVKTAIVWGGGALGVALMAMLLLTGRGANALWALFMFGPAIAQAWRAWRAKRVFGRPAEAGEASGVDTATLEMRLDLATGLMTGRVRRGPQAGRDLAALSLPELLGLLDDCRAEDPESVPLLEAWLDRVEPDWRDAPGASAGQGATPSGGEMTKDEALAVLGLSEGATAEEIRAAHRRLMQAAHPDRGGSDWLAARVNAARERLLRG